MNEITTNQLNITDSKGKVRIRLGVSGNPECPYLEFIGNNNISSRLFISLDNEDSPGIQFLDDKGNLKFAMSSTKHSTGMSILSSEKQPVITIGTDYLDKSIIAKLNKDGDIISEL